jgi:hypothetical protein
MGCEIAEVEQTGAQWMQHSQAAADGAASAAAAMAADLHTKAESGTIATGTLWEPALTDVGSDGSDCGRGAAPHNVG